MRYLDFVDRIDMDAVYDALEWEPLYSRGDEDIGYCQDPFGLHKHGDTTGKLAINRVKHVVNCWVDGGHSLLHWVMVVKDMNAEEATAWLYQFTDSGTRTAEAFEAEINTLLEKKVEEKKSVPFFANGALDKFQNPDLEWLTQRHISQDVADFFKVKYDPKHTRHGYEGPAIILPHWWKDRLVGWQERWLDKDRPAKIGKYTNTVDFPRESTLWGFDFAAKQTKFVYVVESVPTALFLISEGHPAVATFGGSLTEQQLKLLRTLQKVVLAPDNDTVGETWLKEPLEYLQRYTFVLAAPFVKGSGADLGDLVPEELDYHLQNVYFPIPSLT